MSQDNAAQLGRYDGAITVTFLEDGRRVKLIDRFGYIDAQATEWYVPADAIVDGASIPQVLWSIIGGPFEGKYREASVIHDWFCDSRTRAWQRVHRVFYEAMLASQVSLALAKVMYAGVYWGGPRWSETVVNNTNLLADYLKSSRPGGRSIHYPMPAEDRPRGPYAPQIVTRKYQYGMNASDLEELMATLSRSDLLSLDDVDHIVDERVEGREAVERHGSLSNR